MTKIRPHISTYLEGRLGGARSDAVTQDCVAQGGLGPPEGDPPVAPQHMCVTAGLCSAGVGGAVAPQLAESGALCHGSAGQCTV